MRNSCVVWALHCHGEVLTLRSRGHRTIAWASGSASSMRSAICLASPLCTTQGVRASRTLQHALSISQDTASLGVPSCCLMMWWAAPTSNGASAMRFARTGVLGVRRIFLEGGSGAPSAAASACEGPRAVPSACPLASAAWLPAAAAAAAGLPAGCRTCRLSRGSRPTESRMSSTAIALIASSPLVVAWSSHWRFFHVFCLPLPLYLPLSPFFVPGHDRLAHAGRWGVHLCRPVA